MLERKKKQEELHGEKKDEKRERTEKVRGRKTSGEKKN